MSTTFIKNLAAVAAAVTLLLVVSDRVVQGQCSVAPSGMVAWWPGDGNANDIQGPTYENGTLFSGAGYAPGKVGQAFSFDGVDDYAVVPASSAWAFGTGDFTVEFWMYSSTNDDRRPLVNNRKGTGGVPNMWAIEIYNVANRVEFHSGTTILMTATTTLTPSSWNHVAVTRTGSALKMYINGVQAGSGTSSDDFSQVNDLQIGRDLLPLPIGDLGKTFGGKIDELSIFNRSLSDTEIGAIFSAGGNGLCRACTAPPANMVAWWPGDGSAGDIQGPTFENGGLTGTATYAGGKVGQAFSFDGSQGGYVEIPNSSALNPTDAFTVDGWFYIDPAAPGNLSEIGTLAGKSTGELTSYWSIYFDDRGGDKALRFVMGKDVSYTNAIPTANWYHFAGTFDSTAIPRAKLYLNGNLVADSGSAAFNVAANNLPLRIGAMHWTDTFGVGNDRLNGKADEVELLSRALTASEIQSIYNAGNAGKCRECVAAPPNLINWWPGDGNAFDLAGGSNGAAQNGTAYGPGMVQQAFSFDGVDDYVGISMPNINLTAGGRNTVNFWMYWRGDDVGPSGDGRMPFGFAEQYDLYLMQGSFGFNTGTSDIWGISSTGLANRWVHVAAVFNNGDARTNKLYIDGVEQTLTQRQGSTGSKSATQNARISGWAYPAPQNYAFDGSIDEVEVFNRELTAAEVQSIYKARSGGLCISCAAPPANLAAWWRGENNGLDSIGTAHATLFGGTAFGTAMVGRGFVLDGIDDYLRAPASASINVGTANGMTAAAWVRYDNAGGEPLRPIFEWSGEPGDTGGYGSHFYVSAGSGVLFVNLIDTQGTYHTFETAAGVVAPGAFYHVALTYDKTTGNARLFRNGEVVASQNLGTFTPATARNLYIGGRITDVYGGPQYRFGGVIDEAQIFARTLTEAEIQAMYTAGAKGVCAVDPQPPSGCASIPGSLTHWWRAQGSALDYRKANHGTLMNGTTFVNGMLGNAFAFDGINDYVSVPAFDMGGNWTVEGWINPASCSDDNHCTLFARSNGNFDGIWIGYLGAGHPLNNEFAFDIGNGSTWQITLHTNSKYPFGSWYYVAATKNGDTYSLYVNGVLRDQKTYEDVSLNYQTREARMGNWNYGTTSYLQGRIDEMSVYKRPLSPTEVWSLYTAGTSGFSKCAGAETMADMDGDMLSDLAIFRPSGASGAEWWWLKSTGGNGAVQFGSATDTVVTADYTGDGKTDVAFWRPSTGEWYILRSEDYSFYAFPFGSSSDVPVPADYDGDGRADAAVFRASNTTWYISRSTGGTGITQFGAAGDKPVVEDYDGDGKADIAVFRPNGTGGAEWWIAQSSGGVFATQFGQPTDKAVPADYTGDGRADIAFWMPSNGFWYVLRSDDYSYYAFPFGASGDLPVPADYDGDAKTDAGVYRPATANWFISRSKDGLLIRQFGSAGDVPVPNAFVR